jgi:hypothetical protein
MPATILSRNPARACESPRASRAVDDRQFDEIHRRRAEEAADETRRGTFVERLRPVDLLDDALVHHRDAIGEAHRLGLVVRHIDRRRAGLLQHGFELGAHLEAQQRVEIGQGLVHQQNRRLDRERPRHRDALALAAGELGGIAFEIGFDVQQRGGVRDVGLHLRIVSRRACAGRRRHSRRRSCAERPHSSGTPSRGRAGAAAGR